MNGKKLLAMLLCIAMCISMFPTWAFAAEDVLPEETEETQVETVDEAAAEAPAEEPAQKEPEHVQEEAAEEPPTPVADENTDEPEAAVQEQAEVVTPEEADVEAAAATETVSDQAKAEQAEEDIILELAGPSETVVSSDSTDNAELLDDYAAQQICSLLPGTGVSGMFKAPKNAGSKLTGNNRAAYDILKGYIAEVAEGSRTSTVFTITLAEMGHTKLSWTAEELGVESIFALDENGDYALNEEGKRYLSKAATNAVDSIVGISLSQIVSALLADCPYELYWYDKTVGASYSGYSYRATSSSISVEGGYVFSFPVAGDYAAGTCAVDPQYGTAITTAVTTASGIVESCADYSDLNKLKAYKDEICGLTSYNSSAAAGSYDYGYGNPWQLIWVFDGDSATNVVCEGYSKAFQYLCDLSTFSNVTCYTVTGSMAGGTGAGGHMWNMVTMGNGKNYLVDVTNCDERTIGYPNCLFLAGTANGSVSEGYTFDCNGTGIRYTYDSRAIALYTEEDLTVSAYNYADEPGTSYPTEDSIFSSDVIDGSVTNSSAEMTVTMSITAETAEAGYNWGMMVSTSNTFKDAEGNDAYMIWGWHPSNEPREGWTTGHDIANLVPGTTYYYKAVLYRDDNYGQQTILKEEDIAQPHTFTTTGTIADLDTVEIGTNSVPGCTHNVLRFEAETSCLVVVSWTDADYINLRNTDSSWKDCRNVWDESTQTSRIIFSAVAGETILFNVDSFDVGQEGTAHFTVQYAQDVARELTVGSPLTCDDALPLYWYVLPKVNTWYAISLTQPGQWSNIIIWDNGEIQDWGTGFAVIWDEEESAYYSETGASFLWIEFDESAASPVLTLEEIEVPDQFSVETGEIGTDAYGSTWADIPVLYGAPYSDDVEYDRGVYFGPKTVIDTQFADQSGFYGDDLWDYSIREERGDYSRSAPASANSFRSYHIDDLVPGVTYYYQAWLRIWTKDMDGEWVYGGRIFGSLKSFTTRDDATFTPISAGQTAALPENEKTIYSFTPTETGMYAIRAQGYMDITVRSADGNWITGQWNGPDEYGNGNPDFEFRTGFMAKAGEPLYIYIGNWQGESSFTLDTASRIVPELVLDGENQTFWGRQVLQFTAAETGWYIFHIDAHSEYDWDYQLKIADIENFYWLVNYDTPNLMTLQLQEGETVYPGSWFDDENATATYTVTRMVPATEDTISSDAPAKVDGTTAEIAVTMSVTEESAIAGYSYGVMYSVSPSFQDEEGNDSYILWGGRPSSEPRSGYQTDVFIASLVPGTTYYYRAVLFREVEDWHINEDGSSWTEWRRDILALEPIDTTTHRFTIDGSASDLDEMLLDVPVSLPENSAPVYRFTPSDSGLYAIKAVNVDYVNIINTDGHMASWEENILWLAGCDYTAFFYADAGETVCVSAGHWNDWYGSLTAVSADTLAAEATVGGENSSGQAPELFRFTAEEAGWYLFSVDHPENCWYRVFCERDDGWTNKDGAQDYWYLQQGKTIYLSLSFDPEQIPVMKLSVESLGEDFQSVCERVAADPDYRYDFTIEFDETVSGTLEIPANMCLHVRGNMTVTDGAALNIKGEVIMEQQYTGKDIAFTVERGGAVNLLEGEDYAGTLCIQGEAALRNSGLITQGEYSTVEIWGDVESIPGILENSISGLANDELVITCAAGNQGAFETAMAWSGTYKVVNLLLVEELDATLNGDIPDGIVIVVNTGTSLTIPDSAEVNLDGWVAMEGGTVVNDGTLNIRSGIGIWNTDSLVQNNGIVNLTGGIYLRRDDASNTIDNTGGVFNKINNPDLPEGIVISGGTVNDVSAPEDNRAGDNITWVLDNGTLTLTGTGAMWDFATEEGYAPPWYDDRYAVSRIVITDGITRVGNWAFAEMPYLTEVTLPADLTAIGEDAFANSTALTEIMLPTAVTELGDYSFYGSGLTSVVIPNGISRLGEGIFMGCEKLETVTIPTSLAEVGYGCFAGCEALETVIYEGSEPQWDEISIAEGNEPLLNANREYSVHTHVWGEAVCENEVEATCTQEGSYDEVVYCTVCGEELSRETLTIPATGHTPVTDPAVPATCEETGLTEGSHCTVCGEVLVAQEVIPALGHDWDEGVVTTAPTCTEAGVKTYTCKHDGTHTRTDTIPATGHIPGEPVRENEVPATETTAGSYDEVVYCTVCGEELSRIQKTIPVAFRFDDVTNPNDYFYKPVYWAVENGITKGTTPTTFSPWGNCMRSQIVTFLWRYYVQPQPTVSNPFTDVKPSDGFYKAVLWAVENGITTGKTPTTFDPWGPCTRGQVVTFLWRAAGKPMPSTTANFKDVKPSDYFYYAVSWAVEEGITTGTTPTTFNPWGTCMRAQVVTFLYRMSN